jgi:thiol-disulfide isomerase/thioredoxin
MKKPVINATKMIFFGVVFVQIFSLGIFAQKSKTKTVKLKTKTVKIPPKQAVSMTKTTSALLPKVTQIDEAGLKNAIKPNGKPMLVNFWATWCDPCREEFPDLVKLDADYKGKIDFITISLDELSEINRDVPKFLSDMKAEMPSYLLKVEDEGVAIGSITKDWQGGLPFTILYNEKGEIAYFRQGKVKIDALRGEIDKLAPKSQAKN